MVRIGSLVLAAVLALAAWPAAVRAAEADDEATAVFNSLFGSDVDRVARTPDRADDVELAKRLIETARAGAADKPALVAVLCRKAADLAGPGPEGAETAVEAMDVLAAAVPGEAVACAERVVAIREVAYNRARGEARAAAGEALVDALLALADAEEAAHDLAKAVETCRRAQAIARAVKSDRVDTIDARLKGMASVQQTLREIESLKALLAKEPANTAAREKLVRLYLVDFDDPAGAAAHLEGVADASLKKYVPAAAKGVQAAPELACRELGDWYRGLGEAAGAGVKAAMFARARAYYARFLDLHADDDLQRTAATLALKKADAELAKLGHLAPPGPSVTGTGKWIDLLALVDPKQDAVTGEWARETGGLHLSRPKGVSFVAIPVLPQGGYELEVKFTRIKGPDSVSLLLPVGTHSVMLVLGGWGNTGAGLQAVNGKAGDANETRVSPFALENGRIYALTVRVTPEADQVAIAVALDGKPLVAWKGPPSALSIDPGWEIPVKPCLGLVTDRTEVIFASARLRMLSGQAQMLRPPGPATPSTGPAPAVAPAVEPVLAPGQWADLLAGVDPAQDAVQGTWAKKAGALDVAPAHCARAILPGAPGDAYEFEATFVRVDGKSDVAFYLPAGSGKGCWLLIDMLIGQASGLDILDGKRGNANETTVKGPTLTTGKTHAVSAKVRAAGGRVAISVALDGRPFASWEGPISALSVHSSWALRRADRLAVGADNSTVRFTRVRVRALGAEAKAPR